MRQPEIPEDEPERLEALRALGVLDTPPEERFDRYTRLARRLFRVPIALVSLVDADRQWFKSRDGLEATETPRSISFCGHAILSERALVVEDATQDDRFSDNPLVVGEPQIRFYAGHPLADPAGHRIGTLCVIDREPRRFEAEDREALQDIAAMVAGELAALRLATTDALTGLSNRRGFEELCTRALAVCARAERPASVIYLDMDGFKPINDEHGHREGDHALQEMAGLLMATFRASDVVGRLGGDEFAVLLTGTSEVDARRAVARLRVVVASRNATSNRPYALRFSTGVAGVGEGRRSIAALLEAADARMYDDKRDRRRTASAA